MGYLAADLDVIKHELLRDMEGPLRVYHAMINLDGINKFFAVLAGDKTEYWCKQVIGGGLAGVRLQFGD